MSIAQAGVLAIAIVCGVTLVAGAFGLKLSRTTSDFYVAGRSVSAGWNASAIGGEYLSAASFLGIAGLVYALGADMLWFPVGYTVGYVVLLVLVAAPLRRSGAYTLPDFAEARLESRRVRALASLLVVGIGWLYLLPQFQGAGIALSTVTGAPPALGSAIIAVVVVANVTAGGMRSITFVQAFQYWLKLTALAIPLVFLLMAWRADGAPAVPVTFGEGAPLCHHRASSTKAGTEIAVSLSQYWMACTRVIDRMPPAVTLARTTTATMRLPNAGGAPVTVLRAIPAPWNCGSR